MAEARKDDAQAKKAPAQNAPEAAPVVDKEAAAAAEVDALVVKARKALEEFEKLDQETVDRIVAKASVAALNKHLVLAKMAVDETGRGLVEDKATKNIFACEHVTNYMAGQKTVGIIREDDVLGIDEVAEPVGVVAGVTPVTNPTSTAIFKSLISLKTRCPIIFGFHPFAQKCSAEAARIVRDAAVEAGAPADTAIFKSLISLKTRCPIIFGFHPFAQKCSAEAARIVRDAAVEAGAPADCIQWIEHPSIEATGALMKHPGVATILATGGPGARIVRDAAVEAGAPADCIQWIEHPSIEATGALMKHPGVATILATGGPGMVKAAYSSIQWIEHPSIEATGALMKHPGVATILATGGPGMVKAAYSSGKPALGVGAGNAPAYVDANVDVQRVANDLILSKHFDYGMICATEQAIIAHKDIYAPLVKEAYVDANVDVQRVANDLILSKHFDYGMICATEQAIIAHKDIYAPLVKELKRRKAYFVNDEEKAKLEQYMFGCTAYSGQTPKLNAVVPGKSPQYIAHEAGFEIPEDATILAAECAEVGENEPLTMEKLAPVHAVLKFNDQEQGFEMCEEMLKHGAGHTAAIHTNNDDLVREYGLRMHACRIIWNQPSSLGGIGDIYNSIAPSLTLGCGSYGGNSVSGNVQAVNLLNIKRIARRNNNMQWFKIPAKTYFEPNAIKYGGNSVSGNVQAVNLLNIKRIARRNNNMQWFKIPAKTYFEPNAIKYLRDMYGIERAVIVCDKVMEQLGIVDKVIDQLRARSNRVTFRIVDYVELRDMYGIERAVIVCDKVMEQLGIVDKVIDQLRARSNRVTFRIVDYVEPEPSVETVERGAAMMRDEFEPDTIIAVRSAAVRRWTPRRSCGCSTSTRKSRSPTCARSSSTSASARSRFRRSARRPSSCASRPRRARARKSRRSP